MLVWPVVPVVLMAGTPTARDTLTKMKNGLRGQVVPR